MAAFDNPGRDVVGGLRSPGVFLALALAACGPGAAGPGPVPSALPERGALTASTPAARPVLRAVGRGAIPRDVVKTLAQDRRGFLWVATGDGLVRHDGYRFEPLLRDHPDPAQRNLGWVRAMLAARDGRLWLSSEGRGLVSHDPATGRVRDHDRPDDAAPVPDPVVALAEDRDGAIWVGTLGSGLRRQPPPGAEATRPVQHFRHDAADPASLPDDRVEALLVTREGDLWIGGWAGLGRRGPGQAGFERVGGRAPRGAPETLNGRRVLALMQAADGQIWVGAQDGQLVVVDPATREGRWLPGAAERGPVHALVQADDGLVWVGSGRGLELWDAAGAARRHRLRHDPLDPYGLAANEVTALLKDRAGAIWVGGLGIGLQRYDPAASGITVRRPDPARGFDGNVHALLVLADARVLAATSSEPLVQLDARLQPIGPVPLPPDTGRITAMTAMPDGRIWIASDAWLVQLDHRLRVLQRHRHPAGEVVRLRGGPDGSLWVAALDGLFRRAATASPGDGHALQRLTLRGGAPLAGAVQAFAPAPDGALWVAGVGGVYRLPPGQDDGLVEVGATEDATLGNPVVGGLLFDRAGTLWLDTAIAGLHRMVDFDGQARARFERVSTRHGIHNRPFGLNLLEDRRGRIWTQQYVYDPARDRLTELTAADGKDFGMGWFFSYARTPEGRFLFGGTKGILVVEPERFDESTFMPPLAVTALRIDGVPASTAGLARGLRLGPEHHGLAIEFAALEFSDPQRLRYAYRLDDVDADWVTTGADFRVASYGNLAPGGYTLRVKSTNRNGLWNPDELVIPVSVAPAWWQRTELRALALAALLASLLALFRWRTRRLRQRQAELELKVRLRTQELQSASRALELKTAELEQASLTDPLSGLHNRRFLQQHIEADADLCVRRHVEGQAGASGDLIFFMIDIDHFKLVNDRHGHPAGDAVIRQMPLRLRPVFRSGDHLVRWGGEEFLIVARQTARVHAAALAERVRIAVAETPFVLDDGSTLSCTCSIGFACFPFDPGQPDRLGWEDAVRLADAALLEAKAGGRNRWVGVTDPGSLWADGQPVSTRAADWLASGRLGVRRM